jgi:hypothetical protein
MNPSINPTVSVGQHSVSILALLALVLLALGTGVAVATFRSRLPLAPEGGRFLKRLSPLARGAFVILALALALVGFETLFKPEVGMFICLTLLTLGIAGGLLALFFTSKHGAEEPAPGGISSRGWVSLTLLALAGVVLVAQEARVLGPLVARADAGQPSAQVPAKAGTPSPGAAGPSAQAPATPDTQSPGYKVVDLSRGIRPSATPVVPTRSVADDEKDQLKRELQELKRQVLDLERRLSALPAQATNNPGATAPSVPPAGNGPVVVDLTKGLRSASTPPAPERSNSPPPYRVEDLSKGIRRGR